MKKVNKPLTAAVVLIVILAASALFLRLPGRRAPPRAERLAARPINALPTKAAGA